MRGQETGDLNTTERPRALAAIGAAAIVTLAAAPAAATHDEPIEPNGGQAVEACYSAVSPLPAGEGTCRGTQQLARDTAQVCRLVLPPASLSSDTCSAVDGRVHSEAAVVHYEEGDVHRRLALQARLDDGVPLRDALIPATHNSFNTAAATPTLSGLDHNQVASLTDQLRMDMRGLEIDVHWFPSPHAAPADGGKAPVMCHGTTQGPPALRVHIGCTAERPVQDGLAEIDGWLGSNPGEFVLLYLENQLDDDPVAHAAAVRAIEATIGPRVYRPATTCADMPTGLSESDILATGKQVLLVGNCGPGAWGTWVHDRGVGTTWDEEKSGPGDDFVCPPGGFPRFQRFFEDSTWVSHTVEPTGQGSPGEITVAETRAMATCGVNLFGFDQLVAADPRLEALVWSWAPGEPATTRPDAAAYLDVNRRFSADILPTARPFACRDGSSWYVTTATAAWPDGQATCDAERPGSDFSVPHTALDLASFPVAGEVWLDYSRVPGPWVPEIQ